MVIAEYKNQDNNYTIANDSNFLSGLKKINIFVGANNSGKSRFMRQLFKCTDEDFVFIGTATNLNKEVKKVYSKLVSRYHDLYYMKDLAVLANSKTGDYITRFNKFFHTIKEKKKRSSATNGVYDADIAAAIRNEMENLDIFREQTHNLNIKRRHIYIPILRGLRHLDVENVSKKQDLYQIKTNKDYELDQDIILNVDREIFSGLTVYYEIKKMLLGSKEERKFIKEFEDFLSESFFKGKGVTLIPDHDTDNIKVNIDDGDKDREIFNVGDGIQSIIINTFSAFKYKDKSLILFIEEPEMTMHPSVQRVLIETLINKFKNTQVFLTTHSNHFLDLMYDYPGDVTIFSFEEIDKEKFEVKNIGDHSQILDLLGVRNSSVFLSNCVIWTEGVTDRMLLRAILNLDKKFLYQEDYHYAFAEYGGSNLKNFDFVDDENFHGINVSALSRINYIIADNDNEKTGKKFERRKQLKKLLGTGHFFDEHIEIENLIPYQVWIVAIKNFIKEHPTKNIKLKDNPPLKIENQFNKGLEKRKIGDLLKIIIEKKEGNNPKYFSSNDVQCLGTSKKIITEYIINAIEELELNLNDFPLTTKRLVQRLKKFVSEANDNNSRY